MSAVAVLVAFLVSFAIIRLLLRYFGQFGLDRPNDRSLHERPVPRTGGIAILVGAISACALAAPALWLPVLLALLLGGVSFLDDLYRIPAAGRLVAHFAAAAFLTWFLLAPMGVLEMALLALCLVWITNLYNFMDGADGLAAGMSVIGFGAYAAGAWLAGHASIAALCAAIASAAAAFLVYNFHPARIFLGDVGSVPLGFLAAALGLLGWRDDLWPLWFPVLAFGPFIADASVTLLRRVIRGDRVWHAHREHYYQRMVRMGLGHRRTALICYAAMAWCVTLALAGRAQAPALQGAAFGAASVLLLALAIWVELRWRRFVQAAGHAA